MRKRAKLSIFIFFLLSVSDNLFGQKGTTFPSLTGKTLTNQTVTIPIDTKNKFTILAIAYSPKSDKDLNGWIQPIYETFLDKTVLFSYDVNMYFIPMIGGMKQMAGEKIEQRLKAGIDKELHNNVLVYQGSVADYKNSLNFDGKDKPYFFILDTSGKIVYVTSGEYSDKKLEEIEDILYDVME
ncbi:MAG TPA: hypothetical protein VD908_02515 [Cytophagales bacterium]|nr:hypothetical protein [Cytophagales bacterium]